MHTILPVGATNNILMNAQQQIIQLKEPDYEAFHPMLSWINTIKWTYFDANTLYYRIHISTTLCKHYKSPYPALIVYRRNEPIDTETVYLNKSPIENWSSSAQLFVDKLSLVTDVFCMKTSLLSLLFVFMMLWENLSVNELRQKLVIKVLNILCAFNILDWQSEPCYQHQKNSVDVFCMKLNNKQFVNSLEFVHYALRKKLISECTQAVFMML